MNKNKTITLFSIAFMIIASLFTLAKLDNKSKIKTESVNTRTGGRSELKTLMLQYHLATEEEKDDIANYVHKNYKTYSASNSTDTKFLNTMRKRIGDDNVNKR